MVLETWQAYENNKYWIFDTSLGLDINCGYQICDLLKRLKNVNLPLLRISKRNI